MIYQAVIVAGGKGERFGNDIPKQFLNLHSKPVLSWSIEAFFPLVKDLVVVLPEDQVDHWLNLSGSSIENIDYIITNGGRTRSESVLNGLNALPQSGDSLIAIHDAARPLITQNMIRDLFRSCEEHGNAVPVTKMRDSLRSIGDKGASKPLDRDRIVAVQTPQIFTGADLRKAYADHSQNSFTDDAGLVESAGMKVHLVNGDPWNIKLTYPDDLIVAESLIIK
mgnify:CR=1 FL=1